jgi:hypothetical protein
VTRPGTPDPGAWTEPARVAEAGLDEPSLLVDEDGVAHIAAVREGSVVHLTNRTGEWTEERLSTPPGSGLQAQADGQPSIAIDDDGTLAVAFTRWGPDDTFGRMPDGVYYTNNRSGGWSQPVLLVDDENGAHSPSLEMRAGRLHLAYVSGVAFDIVSEDMSFPVRYGSAPEGEAWNDVEISANGTEPVLELADDGTPHVLFGDEYGLLEGDALRLAVGLPDGTFDVGELDGSSRYGRPYGLLLDGQSVSAAWSRPGWASSDDRWAAYYQWRDGDWSEPQLLMLDGTVRAADIGADGTVHAIGGNLDGIWYARGTAGSFAVVQLSGQVERGSDVAVDADGRPHVVFLISDEGGDQLWYMTGPAG